MVDEGTCSLRAAVRKESSYYEVERSNAQSYEGRTLLWAGNAFPKQCSCGAIYNESDWLLQPYHGIFRGTDDSTGRQFSSDLEIRVCVCGSSMAVQLNESNDANV